MDAHILVLLLLIINGYQTSVSASASTTTTMCNIATTDRWDFDHGVVEQFYQILPDSNFTHLAFLTSTSDLSDEELATLAAKSSTIAQSVSKTTHFYIIK